MSQSSASALIPWLLSEKLKENIPTRRDGRQLPPSALWETDEQWKEVGIWWQTGYSKVCPRHTLIIFLWDSIPGGIRKHKW